MLHIKQFVFNPFGENTFVVSDDASRDAVVIDPGMTSTDEQRHIDRYITGNGLNVTAVVNTHLHLDHCFGDNYLRDRYDVRIHAHSADAPLGATLGEQARRFGMIVDVSSVDIDVPLSDGDTICIGGDELQVLHVPGHSPGGIALYSPSGRFVIAGDSLFEGSIGRTDLPGGDMTTLVNAIRGKLLTLPDDTIVLPGHGSTTTIAREKTSNPFLR